MFGLGSNEMIVILIIGIIVIGPKEIPKVLKTIRKVIRTVRSYSASVYEKVDDIIDEADGIKKQVGTDFDPEAYIQKEFGHLKEFKQLNEFNHLKDTFKDVKDDVNNLKNDWKEVKSPLNPDDIKNFNKNILEKEQEMKDLEKQAIKETENIGGTDFQPDNTDKKA